MSFKKWVLIQKQWFFIVVDGHVLYFTILEVILWRGWRRGAIHWASIKASIITVSLILRFCCFFSKFPGNPGPGGTKAVLGVKWSTNHSPTEPAKSRNISIFRAKNTGEKINYFLLQSWSLLHISTIPHDPARFWMFKKLAWIDGR